MNENEFEYEGKKFVAIEEDGCDNCFYGKDCALLMNEGKIPACAGTGRTDKKSVIFVEKPQTTTKIELAKKLSDKTIRVAGNCEPVTSHNGLKPPEACNNCTKVPYDTSKDSIECFKCFADSHTPPEFKAWRLIQIELKNAKAKHPDFTDNPLAVLVEEVGEIATAVQNGDAENLKQEIAQTAAVCVRWLEKLQ